ncbi:metalloregulator ArsR/SmtB family transcription factor [Rhizobiaceae bacterium BDR2-2]|uniref:Metalloregulator ArsR/SmtB family transcription factor n=1 Tax=Ectorhizobium quercum TaxID=2965071 RepID=A0AAE3STZ4_9HYPH|nr:metalloregulator ArsR/SmtB family transcription factor [Ectorhizobium quercum]MCX8996487.1 metalloregulator ArsR/SmtB family transcription factor [Ectorhizobium quercum]
MATFGLEKLVDILKAAGETTRLRLLVLLSSGDLTVTDLTDILGQSQPRISRHLKLLAEDDLVERYQEGAWAYFRLRRDGAATELVRAILAMAERDDPVLVRDAQRLVAVKRQRSEKAQAYFSRNASEWDELRRLHVNDEAVEAALLKAVGDTPVGSLLDLGTGTGRMLQLLEGLYSHATGIDASRDMLSVARANLDKGGIVKASVRQGDIFNLPVDDEEFDLVTIHQVLHFLDQPQLALAEAARVIKPGGRLAVIDLAPHDLDHLREDHAHVRLGFAHEAMAQALEKAGLAVEKVIDIPPGGQAERALTVTIWLARDPRPAAA